METYTKIFNLFLDVEGRGSRFEFWIFLICLLGGGSVLAILDAMLGWYDPANGYGPLVKTFLIVAYVPTVVATVRRLHDINLSGWWILSFLIPFVGFVTLLALMFWAPTQGVNSYGPR